MRPTKTLGVMRNSLSSSNPLLSQQQLSTSAPVNQSYMSEAAAAASGSGHPRVWARREPRQHFSSVCSVGETSTLAEEVNDVLSRMDPNDLQDIVSDDEEDGEEDGSQAALNEAQTTDGKLTSARAHGHFYCIQKVILQTKATSKAPVLQLLN